MNDAGVLLNPVRSSSARTPCLCSLPYLRTITAKLIREAGMQDCSTLLVRSRYGWIGECGTPMQVHDMLDLAKWPCNV